MENLSFKNSLRLKEYQKNSVNSPGFPPDHNHNYDLYAEDYFHGILCYERKRTERSKRPCLLMLLNIKELLQTGHSRECIEAISTALFLSTREIDVKGWYRQNYDIGILFMELEGIDKISLKNKICNNLRNSLNHEQINKIKISLHAFPENSNDDAPEGSSHSTLYPDITKRKGHNIISQFIKRTIDIIGSIMALIILSPLFLIVSICIKFTSKGPVIFRQKRIGQFGKKFTFLKFRSMYVNNNPSIHQEYIKKLILEKDSNDTNNVNSKKENVYKIKNDPRIAPIGRFLRKTSIDEFPQFINVLKGEMSLVGPRPPLPYEMSMYDIWHRRRVMEAKPGITGLWQVIGRSSTTFDEMVRLDIRYIKGWSIWLDIKILVQTPWVVLMGKGAY